MCRRPVHSRSTSPMHQQWHDWPSADRIIGRRPVDTAHKAGTPADELANPDSWNRVGRQRGPSTGHGRGVRDIRSRRRPAPAARRQQGHLRGRARAVRARPVIRRPGDTPQVARNVTESMKGVPSRVGLALDEGRTAAAKRRALRTHESRGRTSTLGPLATRRRCRQRYGSAPISATPSGPTQGRCWTARFLARYGDRS